MKNQMNSDNSSETKKLWGNAIHYVDQFLNWLFRYHGRYEIPTGFTTASIWAIPIPNISTTWANQFQKEWLQPEEYFLHYFQSQGYGPTRNECVTTSAVMAMNIAKDRIASMQGNKFERIPDLRLEDYTREMDDRKFRGWKYRFSTHSWLPGMMTPWQAVMALRDFGKILKLKYGKTYSVRLSARHNLNDLIKYLAEGRIVLIHGARQMTLQPNKNHYNHLLPWLGGMPHTMVLVGYMGSVDQWILLNPSEPWLEKRNNPDSRKLFQMPTRELLTFWGRQFIFYPPRFSVTVITLEV